MSKHAPDSKIGKPAPLSEKISRIARSLGGARFDPPQPDAEEATGAAFDVAEDAVNRVFQMWQARADYLPQELLSDPAWGMLLELLLAEIQGRRVSLSRLCNVSSVPASSALRWFNGLERRGLAVRRTDPQDADVQFVELSGTGRSALRRYFHDVVQSQEPFEQRR